MAVTDSGIGTNAPQVAELFQAFSPAHTSTTREYGGTGLGPAIGRKFCRMMGVTVESVEGVGSTSTVRVPAEVVDPAAMPSPVPTPADEEPADEPAIPADGSGRLVLVVEDDPALRELERRTLEKAGWRVVEAIDGGPPLEELEGPVPRLIVLDLLMPHVDGFDVIEHLRQRPAWAAVPVVVLTASDLSADDRGRLDTPSVRQVIRTGGYRLGELTAVVRAAIGDPAAEPAGA